ncbi:MAG: glycerate kinase [Myxococcota bacterium]
MKVVVAMDSFKGSLRAPIACEAVRRGILEALPGAEVALKPMADGGEGTAETVIAAVGGEWVGVGAMGPLPDMRVEAGYARIPTGALVEMAAASGIELLADPDRNPLRTTTFGTGQLLAAAAASGARHLWLAIGGSATVDGGTGAACAMGWRFLDERGEPIGLGGGQLERIDRIERPETGQGALPPVTVLCDVDNPLLGERGAARVFGPQKGANPEMVELLERGLSRLADVIERDLDKDVRHVAGAGAAGGLGAGALAFFDADLVSGVEAMIEATGLAEALAGADWVVTGEGRFDEQSLYGKVVAGVLAAAGRATVPVAVIAGSSTISPDRAPELGLRAIEVSTPAGSSFRDIAHRAEELLTAAAHRLADTAFRS